LIKEVKLELMLKAQREKAVVSGWAVERGINAFEIEKVTLHGRLKKLVNANGDFVGPQDAKVEGNIQERPFNLNLKCDPCKFDDFVHKIFHG
jgi:hypothetical protein